MEAQYPKLENLLRESEQTIVEKAAVNLGNYRLKNYEMAKLSEMEWWLGALFSALCDSIEQKCLEPFLKYSEKLGRLRAEKGFDLKEVQIAYNLLEEHIWEVVLEKGDPKTRVEDLVRISEIVAAGKDKLTKWYYKEEK
jgi:hypothetical protein